MQGNCLIIAGEKSGEDHCLSFFNRLKQKVPDVHFWGVGGDSMASLGFENIYHLTDFSSWGFSAVIKKIPFYKKALERIENEVIKRGTQIAILIDYQGFNLKLAQRLKKRNVKVLYYVAPQAWAWKAYRAEILEKNVHTLFTIIPFEKKWFEDRGVKRVKSIVHPLVETYKDELPKKTKVFHTGHQIKILLLPGSRNFEVASLLPEFVNAIQYLKKYKLDIEVACVCSSSVKKENFWKISNIEKIKIYNDKELANALNWADLCIASSGTVTLACALFQVPTVVTYIVSHFNYFIYETLIPYNGFVSLANIVHQKDLFPEFIQNHVSGYNIANALLKWINNPTFTNELIGKLKDTVNLLEHDSIDVPSYMASVIHGE